MVGWTQEVEGKYYTICTIKLQYHIIKLQLKIWKFTFPSNEKYLWNPANHLNPCFTWPTVHPRYFRKSIDLIKFGVIIIRIYEVIFMLLKFLPYPPYPVYLFFLLLSFPCLYKDIKPSSFGNEDLTVGIVMFTPFHGSPFIMIVRML